MIEMTEEVEVALEDQGVAIEVVGIEVDNNEKEIGLAQNATIQISDGGTNAIAVTLQNLMMEAVVPEEEMAVVVDSKVVMKETEEMEIAISAVEECAEAIVQVVDLTAKDHIKLLHLLSNIFLRCMQEFYFLYLVWSIAKPSLFINFYQFYKNLKFLKYSTNKW